MVGRLVVIIGALLGSASPAIAAPTEVKIKIEAGFADALDAVKVLERLNANGEDHNLHFQMVESSYDFRIAVAAGGWSGIRAADTRAAILTPDCRFLFIVSRYGRFTESGALNAIAKEIASKLALYLKAPKPGQAAK